MNRVLKFTPEEQAALNKRAAQNPAKITDRHMDRTFGGLVALKGIQKLVDSGMDIEDAYDGVVTLYMNAAKTIAQGLIRGEDIDLRGVKVGVEGELH